MKYIEKMTSTLPASKPLTRPKTNIHATKGHLSDKN